jgi:hypothetical protein
LVSELTRLREDVPSSDQIATLVDFAEHHDDAGARTFACLLYALDRTDSDRLLCVLLVDAHS